MDLKYIFVIFVAIYSQCVWCQSISCSYGFNRFNNYTCFMTIDNLNNFDGFLNIYGIHDISLSNFDVSAIEVVDGTTTIIPQIFCTEFPNLQFIEVRDNKLKYLTETSFSSCSQLRYLDARNNTIEEIHPDTFKLNPQFDFFYVSNTSLTTLPETLFDHNPKLRWFYFFYNLKLTNLPGNILRNASMLQDLFVDSNNLDAWNPAWSQSKKLALISMTHNKIKEIPENAFNSSNLVVLRINSNDLSVLNSTSFGDLSSLEVIYAKQNRIQSIDEKIFKQTKDLRIFSMDTENTCAGEILESFIVNRDANLAALKSCFDSFEGVKSKNLFLRYFNDN